MCSHLLCKQAFVVHALSFLYPRILEHPPNAPGQVSKAADHSYFLAQRKYTGNAHPDTQRLTQDYQNLSIFVKRLSGN